MVLSPLKIAGHCLKAGMMLALVRKPELASEIVDALEAIQGVGPAVHVLLSYRRSREALVVPAT